MLKVLSSVALKTRHLPLVVTSLHPRAAVMRSPFQTGAPEIVNSRFMSNCDLPSMSKSSYIPVAWRELITPKTETLPPNPIMSS